MKFTAYPMKVKPIFKERVWGDRNLNKMIKLPRGKKIGEIWYFAGHGENHSVIENGIYKGRRITEIMQKFSVEMLGPVLSKKYNRRFPVLLKFLDSEEKLSVQVHPDDAFALKNNKSWGKTEAWYILDASKKAKLMVGLKKKLSKERLGKAVKDGSIAGKLKTYIPKKGDCFFIPSGTLHVVAGGCIILEIQQNSDITYRVYDWGRTFDGNPRQLHVPEALKVYRHENKAGRVAPVYPDRTGGITSKHLIDSSYFGISEVQIEKNTGYWYNNISPVIITVLRGSITLSTENGSFRINSFESAFIPVSLSGVLMLPGMGSRIIMTEIK